jgi:hypothetical protein
MKVLCTQIRYQQFTELVFPRNNVRSEKIIRKYNASIYCSGIRGTEETNLVIITNLWAVMLFYAIILLYTYFFSTKLMATPTTAISLCTFKNLGEQFRLGN